MVSYNPYDVIYAYCGRCQAFKPVAVVDVDARKLAMTMVKQVEFRSTMTGTGD